MSRLAEVRVPVDQFPLGRIMSSLPEASVTLESIVPTGDVFVPYFWVTGVDPEQVLSVLDSVPELCSVQHVDMVNGRNLFRATWVADTPGIVTALREADLTLLSGHSTGEEWLFELRGPSESLSAFHEYCSAAGVPVDVSRLQPLSQSDGDRVATLTDQQREALVLAFERGYYDGSRDVTLADLAAELDISRQAFAARLRRGYRALVAGLLAPTEPERYK